MGNHFASGLVALDMKPALLLLASLLFTFALADSSLPNNDIQNGSFESGFVQWIKSPGAVVSLGTPGTLGSAHYLESPDRATGASSVTQPLASLLWSQGAPWIIEHGRETLLDFDARIEGSPASPAESYQSVQLQSGAWDATTGIGQVTASVGFHSHTIGASSYSTIRVAIYTTNTNAGYYTVGGPNDGAWHHYSLVLDPVTRSGALFMDNKLLEQVFQPGYPNGSAVAAADTIIVGDTDAGNAARGAAPRMGFDELYFGEGTLIF